MACKYLQTIVTSSSSVLYTYPDFIPLASNVVLAPPLSPILYFVSDPLRV